MWLAAVQPLIRPFIASLYSFKRAGSGKGRVPKFIIEDQKNVKSILLRYSRRYCFLNDYWDTDEADYVVFTDASKLATGAAGIGIYFKSLLREAYVLGRSEQDNTRLELWAIIVAVHVLCNREPRIQPEAKILIYTDSQAASYAMAKRMGVHNDSLKALTFLQLEHKFSIRCVWIHREFNTVADGLSNGKHSFTVATQLALPEGILRLAEFTPLNKI
jgi:ribonuclease HI